MDVEYDPAKAVANPEKHGVWFEEAASALLDPMALVVEDGLSEDETRHVLLGMSAQGRLLVVVYAHRGERIRLISARRASRGEAQHYA